jgi:(E)-4-hydroxy-3-methylbut-2-enyl-diphosphate synthase
VFIDGRHAMTLRGPTIAAEFSRILEEYVERKFAPEAAKGPGGRATLDDPTEARPKVMRG